MKRLLCTVIFAAIFSCTTLPEPETRDLEVRKTWSNELIYFLLLDRFHNGDTGNDFNVNPDNPLAYHGGDLKGLTLKLRYLQRLNTGTILFNPLMDNRNHDFFGHHGFHGYWIIDHYKIDEHFGDKEEFEVFNRKRLSLNMKLLLDIVLNHVDWDHPLVKERPGWFHTMGSITDWNDPRELIRGQVSGLPDLKQENPEVEKELLKYSKYWINLSQADGLRIDAVKHMDHRFLRKYIFEINEYVKKTRGKKDFLFLAEILHGDPQYYLPYLLDGFNSFYDYPLYYTVADVFARHLSMFNLAARLQSEDRVFPKDVVLVTFPDNHDVPRFLSLSETVNYKDLYQAITFYMTVRGLPMIYYGTEAFMTGKTGEAGRLSLDFRHLPGSGTIRKLAHIRRTSTSLTTGLREDLLVTHSYYVFRKISPLEESIIFLTRSSKPLTLELPIERNSLFYTAENIQDRLSGKEFKINDHVLHARLRAKDSLIFTIQGKALRYRHLISEKTRMKDLKILVTGVSLGKDEKLYMAGNVKQLGHWNPEKAHGPLLRISSARNETTISVPLSTILEYKFIKVKKNGSVVWENTPNRFFFVTTRSPHQITQKWNTPREPVL